MQHYVVNLLFSGVAFAFAPFAITHATLSITFPMSFLHLTFPLYKPFRQCTMCSIIDKILRRIMMHHRYECLASLDFQRLHWSSTKTSLMVLTASCWTSVRLASQSTSSTSLPCSVASGSSSASICDRTIALFM